MKEPRYAIPAPFLGRNDPNLAAYTAVWIDYPEFDGTQNCAVLPTESFFAPDDVDPTFTRMYNEYAVRLCEGCPFLVECREYAIAHEAEGVWGGMTAKQRMRERKARKWMLAERQFLPTLFTRDRIDAWTSQHDTDERETA